MGHLRQVLRRSRAALDQSAPDGRDDLPDPHGAAGEDAVRRSQGERPVFWDLTKSQKAVFFDVLKKLHFCYQNLIKMAIFTMDKTSCVPGRTNHFREPPKYVLFSLPGDLVTLTDVGGAE